VVGWVAHGRCCDGDRGNGLGGTGDGCGGNFSMVGIILVSGHREEGCFRGIDGFAPEFQMPIDECAVLVVNHGIFQDDRPGANSFFTPVMLLVPVEDGNS